MEPGRAWAEQGRRTERSSQGEGGGARGGCGSERGMGCVPRALEASEKPLLSLAIWRFLATHGRLLGVVEGTREARKERWTQCFLGVRGGGSRSWREAAQRRSLKDGALGLLGCWRRAQW